MTALTPGAARSADGTRGGWFRPPQSLASLAWVTWRQHRAAIIGLAVLYGGLAVIMVWAALQGHANYTALIRDRCIGSTQLVRCGPLLGDFPWLMNTTYPIAVAMALHIVPLLTGMFLGAPVLAREFEQGTVRFAWTQGTSRTRWAVVQLTLLAIPVTAAAAALGALAAWSVRPFGPMWGGEPVAERPVRRHGGNPGRLDAVRILARNHRRRRAQAHRARDGRHGRLAGWPARRHVLEAE
jgi:hypothetical protein